MEIEFCVESWAKANIKDCQLNKHVQQVAYSTYHNALTQICFTCKKIRTSIKPSDVMFGDLKKSKTVPKGCGEEMPVRGMRKYWTTCGSETKYGKQFCDKCQEKIKGGEE